MNKKGSVQDLVTIMIVLLLFGTITLISFVITSAFNDNIQANSVIPDEAKSAASWLTSFFPGVVDNSFLFLTIGLAIVAFIMASLVRIHPIFLVFYIIAFLFVIMFSAIFSNIYTSMAADSNFSAYAEKLTFTSFILSTLPFIVAILGTIIMVVMYKVGDTVG